MKYRFLIVEDSLLIAMDLEEAVARAGHEVIGIAPDMTVALNYAKESDIAFVDVRLADGETGPRLARMLVDRGVLVVFVTGNPMLVEGRDAGALGVIPKPLTQQAAADVIDFVVDWKSGRKRHPPARMRLFQPLAPTL
ncbi:response regulator [Rhizobium sp. SSA_523]|uniref:response regulator n=1 Tax=Rhizobium sp. SSA_523 TaxID=2952477 RepID=UPI0020905C2F|nr:response regulator [Rhizobium sp. SSA_523]MCO5734003.1 response regulator [Rhizobium sp. SSA_523]WKC24647.1 response regulator [Rhizobium sp. SSA_523]